MWNRGISGFSNYCSRFFGRGYMHYYTPWHWLIGIAVLVVAIVIIVVVVKAISKKNSGSDELLELLKTKYVKGEITEEEYLKKKKTLKK